MSEPEEEPRRASARRWMSPDFLSELFSNPLDPGYADAAARRAKEGPPTGWRHGSRRVAAVIVAGLIGLLFAVAYRQTVADEPRRSQARADLVTQIKQRQDATDNLRNQADGLRDAVARERDAALGGDEAAQRRDVEAATGLRRVTGDGLVVRLADAPDADEKADENDLGRIFDRDLQLVTNALWASGAEAIAINDQRLTATSTIRKAGGAILVDFRPVTSPYEIRVIGPRDLEDRFADTAAAALMRKVADGEHIGFDTRRQDDLNLPAATEPQLNYATRPTPASATPTPGVTSSSPSGGG
ncbi:uncharacterized protein YlxW (UPF0749 family) [Asanoa ferruginea]|uniref:Uncharacterized protein YlxW (UPF0749 family) n=2 Tax=Asanoa ferruginea TaxID=53367 RepID=A0A3D9ZTH2_9ACTN|nr:uncharacterized protein YlxW (UPF0749 family) [Asanoa ferruginea]GIF47438.1 hypothetical protein Afe04nite_19770 [Asanoa ferruginea]